MNPSGTTTPGLRALPADLNDDSDELAPASSAAKSDREGLPSSYRMRADSHYVEQLSVRRTEAPRPRVDLESTTDADRRDRDRDRQVGLLLAQLAEHVASIEAAAAQIGGDRSGLARRAGVDVVRAEAWRASWLLRAIRIVDGTHTSRSRLRQIAPMLADLQHRLAPEFRLTGSQLHVIASDWNASVDVDEAALVTAVTGAVFAVVGLVGDASGASVRVTVMAAAGNLQSLEVAQDDVAIADPVLKRFFDADWSDRPGGSLAGLGAQSARAFARLMGGDAAISGGRRGCTLRLDFGPS